MQSYFVFRHAIPHHRLRSVEWIKVKSRISRYYSHFILRFMLFSFASFSPWPTSSDRFCRWKFFLLYSHGVWFVLTPALWDFASLRLPFVFVIWNGPTGSTDPVGLSFWSERHIAELERILICTRVQCPDNSLWIGGARLTLALVGLKQQ